MELRVCPACSKPFRPTRGNQTKCPVCVQASFKPKRVLKKVKCATCGKIFITNLYNKKYCCKACREHADTRLRLNLTKVCPYCKKEFTTTKSRRKFCSETCAQAAKHLYDSQWYLDNKARGGK